MSGDQTESAFAKLGRRELMRHMHDQVDELLAARDQMERLLQAIVDVGTDLQLDATLHRIVAAAQDLTGARYCALAVYGSAGGVTSFVHTGMDAETVRRIGRLPVGKGLLGLPIGEMDALRLDDLTHHPAAVGFPEHHPPMQAFLGVPITIRNSLFGGLYMTHHPSTQTFTEADEVAARALASSAATAIDNAQLFERIQESAKWTNASREITTALLSGVDPPMSAMRLIAERARELTNAEQAIVLVPMDADSGSDEVNTLVVDTAVGLYAAEVVGQRIPIEGSTTGGAFRSGEPIITESFRHLIPAFTDVGQRPAIVMPLRANETVLGVIAVARNAQQPPFEASYLELVSDFAAHATIALTLAAGRDRERELTLLADRERIAHDLHDHVIQRLFAAGMDLQGTVARARSPEITERLSRTVDDLQATIEDIRNTIFQLRFGPGPDSDFRRRIQQLVAELTDDREVTTTLRMSGPMNAVGGELAENAEAVVTEAVSNVLRHAQASQLMIDIDVADLITLVVDDDGRGIPANNSRQSGLANMRRRAEQLGGTCEITTSPEAGTRVRWRVPITGS
jgi:signal transduction histidine kinase